VGCGDQPVYQGLLCIRGNSINSRSCCDQPTRPEDEKGSLHRADGTPLPREYASNCEGHERGDTIQVVLDPAGRFAPISGPKSDMSTTGELQVTAIAALTLLICIALGSPPKRKTTKG
jgi:hypothetical protein